MKNEDFSECCGEKPATITRFIVADLSKKALNVFKDVASSNKSVVEYKASVNRSSSMRSYSRKTITAESGIETKITARQVGRSIVSTIIPGDVSPIRSPIRSAVWRTITPGLPGGGGGGTVPGRNRGYRCPEGYQYGGRFTDSRLSTCGAKLFDIPSPLGLALSAVRRAIRGPAAMPGVTGEILGGAPSPGNIIVSRDPNTVIPKVSAYNQKAALARIKEMVEGLSNHRSRAARMVRRDGFVLEPVVPARVLRSVPDNRDMEGATYLLSAFSAKDFGNDEMGLLSNTGISSVMYVMPGGSVISLSKARELTVGERRKLGKTIKVAERMINSKDPAARLKYVADEMGDGISYSEKFVGIKNPNEIINGKPNWTKYAFDMSRMKSPKKAPNFESTKDTDSARAAGSKIKSVDEALEHVANGGSLSDIDSSILGTVLAKSDTIAKQRIDAKQTVVVVGNRKYVFYTRPDYKFQHLAERFASDVQQHLGLESPDVLFVGKAGDRRQYLREDIETSIPGATFNPNAKMSDFKPQDVARMMISDILTDQRGRPMTSVYGVTTMDGEVPVLAQNFTSGLVDLSKIEITKRMKLGIAGLYGVEGTVDYSKYYKELKIEQQIVFRKFLDSLIRRAREFEVRELRRKLNIGGLSDGEKQHLEIIGKIYAIRLDLLTSSKRSIIDYLRG